MGVYSFELVNTNNSSVESIHKIELLGTFFAVCSFFFLPISTSATWISVYLAAIFSLLSGGLKNKFNLIFDLRITYFFIALFLLAFISISYSIASHHEALTMLKHQVKFVIVLFLIPFFSRERFRCYAINAFLLAAGLTIVVGYGKYFDWIHINMHKGSDGAFKNHIQTSFILTAAVYLWAEHLFNGQTTAKKILYFLLILLAFTQILFISRSRSGYLILFTTSLLFCWQYFRNKGLLYTLIIFTLGFLCIFTFPNTLQKEFTLTLQNLHKQNSSVNQRLDFYREALNHIQHHPFIGSGTGSIVSVSKNAFPQSLTTHNFHNEYFNMWVQYGALGVIAVFLIFYFCLKESKKLPLPWKRKVQATVAIIAVGSLFNAWLMDATEGYFFCLFIIMCMAAMPKKSKT